MTKHALRCTGGWGPSVDEQFGPCAIEVRPAPISQDSIILICGKIACEIPEHLGKVKDDIYVTVCRIPCVPDELMGLDIEIVGCGSKTRAAIRPEPYRVRLNGDQIQVRVIKGNRAPMSLDLSGLVCGISDPVPLVPRFIDPLRAQKTIQLNSPLQVTCQKVGDWVLLSGSVMASMDFGTFKELSHLLPEECRPDREIEFIVPHQTVSMCRIYPDGRIVVDGGRRDSIAANSAMVVNKGPVQFGGVRYSTNETGSRVKNLFTGSSPVLGQELVVHEGNGICMLQGKLRVVPQKSACQEIKPPRQFYEDRDLILLAKLESGFEPPETMCFFVLNKLNANSMNERTSRILIDTRGYIWGNGFEDGVVRIISFTGFCWARSTKAATLGATPAVAPFLSRLGDTGYQKLSSAIAEGIYDYSVRLGVNTRLDTGKVVDSVVKKRVRALQTLAQADISSGWTKRLLEMYPQTVKEKSTMEPVAERIARDIYEKSKLDSILSKLQGMCLEHVARDERPSVGSMALMQRQFTQATYSMRSNIIEQIRAGGKKCKHQLHVMKNADEQELATLGEVVNWWLQWSSNDKYLTHSSLMGNNDIFSDTGKWTIPDDPGIQDQLFKYMAWIYKKGYDTFISEIQTPLFPLIEDLDMESTLQMDNTKLLDEMFMDHKLVFVKERARALQILYPQRTEFTCYIYSSSGFNKSKGRWKSSFHLVWPDLIINGELAPIIRQTTVEYFLYKSATNAYFKRMQARLINHYDANIWENVFDQTTSNAANGLRMPFCNKASWIKTVYGSKVPNVENRRCFPKGAVTIKFERSEFDSPELESAAREKAMRVILEAEKRDAEAAMIDQNALVGDRTQYKQADKNSIHRTSAFMAGMKNGGGDLREFWKVNAEWSEVVRDPESLSEEEVARWIRRGSCRRLMSATRLSTYNNDFVDCYLKADLLWFEGHTLESLRETEKYQKLTPAGQRGLKNRFQKYLQSQAGGGHLARGTAGSDIVRLHELALRVREAKKIQLDDIKENIPFQDIDDEEEDEEAPPMDDEEDHFDLWRGKVENIFSFYGSIPEFKSLMGAHAPSDGYWVHAPMALIWLAPRESPRSGWESCVHVGHVRNQYAKSNQQVSVAFYHHCGKIVVSGHSKDALIETVARFAQPDDRLYNRLVLPESSDEAYLFNFSLIDRATAASQREQYEVRWRAMRLLTDSQVSE